MWELLTFNFHWLWFFYSSASLPPFLPPSLSPTLVSQSDGKLGPQGFRQALCITSSQALLREVTTTKQILKGLQKPTGTIFTHSADILNRAISIFPMALPMDVMWYPVQSQVSTKLSKAKRSSVLGLSQNMAWNPEQSDIWWYRKSSWESCSSQTPKNSY